MKTVSLLAAVLALALPATALAQGAGDEQYSDPFGSEQPEQSQPTPAPTPAPAQAPTAQSPSQSQPVPTATPAPAQAPAATAAQLPRTGADAGWLALAGAVLLAAGLALRRRADHQR